MKDGSKNKFCSKIYYSIVNANGLVPLVRLGLLQANKDVNAKVSGKCQFFNPLSLVKDRVWLAMIEATKPNNEIQGIGLGFVSKNSNPGLIGKILPISLWNRPPRGTYRGHWQWAFPRARRWQQPSSPYYPV